VIGQIGDLVESAIKRSIGTKDTGGLIPGHGGYAGPNRQLALQRSGPLPLFDVRLVPRMKSITLLGATGSVGLRTLDMVSSFPEEFSVAGLAARGSNVERVADLCKKYSPRAVALLERTRRDQLRAPAAVAAPRAARRPRRLCGARARRQGRHRRRRRSSAAPGSCRRWPRSRPAGPSRCANKETLVMAGRLMTAAARSARREALPVDSEHSAVFQCLLGHSRADVHRILLTASGGPFRETPKARLATRHRRGCAPASRRGRWAPRSRSTRPRS
jgi:1-deoxy-D-xylulose-5-phosphate reductoisomerase